MSWGNYRLVRHSSEKRSGFVGTVSFHQKGDGRLFVIDRDFLFISKSGLRITVNQGFETDLATIPRPIWVLLPPFGIYTDACVVHDWLCSRKGVVGFNGDEPVRITRRECDDILLEAMQDCGVPRWQRCLVYRSVRLFSSVMSKW